MYYNRYSSDDDLQLHILFDSISVIIVQWQGDYERLFVSGWIFLPPARLEPRTTSSAGQCLTHCILVDSYTVVSCTSPFIILGVSSLFYCFYSFFLWRILLVNKVGPDKMPHDVASDLGLHCLPMIHLWVSR